MFSAAIAYEAAGNRTQTVIGGTTIARFARVYRKRLSQNDPAYQLTDERVVGGFGRPVEDRDSGPALHLRAVSGQ